MQKIFILIILLLSGSSSVADLTKQCKNKKITVYTKIHCVFCIKLKDFLITNDVVFKEIDISNNKILFSWLIKKTGAHTVPYVFLENEFIGGYTEFINKCSNKHRE